MTVNMYQRREAIHNSVPRFPRTFCPDMLTEFFSGVINWVPTWVVGEQGRGGLNAPQSVKIFIQAERARSLRRTGFTRYTLFCRNDIDVSILRTFPQFLPGIRTERFYTRIANYSTCIWAYRVV